MMLRKVPQIALVAIVVIAWIAAIGAASSSAENAEEIERQIQEAEELGTYKTVLELYDQMASANPEDPSWLLRKADAYYAMGSNNSYTSTCERIIQQFPDDPAGYEKLMSFYDEKERIEKLLETYQNAPEIVQGDETVLDLYRKHEYDYEIISEKCDSVEQFSADFAVVCIDGYYGYMNSDGSVVIETDFDDARVFLEERAAVKKDGEWYLIDGDGDRVAASRDDFSDLYSPSEGYALAKVGNSYGYYDENLKNPQHFEFEDATSFFNGVAAVKKGGKWALIDASFSEITGYEFDDVVIDFSHVCSRKGRLFAKNGGSWRLFDLEGNRVGDASFDDARLFYDDLAAVKQGGKWGFVDEAGDIAIECNFDGAESFNRGVGGAKQGELWGYVDANGDFVVDPEFDGVLSLSAVGVSGVALGDSMRYIHFYKFTGQESEEDGVL